MVSEGFKGRPVWGARRGGSQDTPLRSERGGGELHCEPRSTTFARDAVRAGRPTKARETGRSVQVVVLAGPCAAGYSDCFALHTWNSIVSKTSDVAPDFSRSGGLLPAIAQDADTDAVLMLAWMNAESYAETLATGRAVYFSRSRGKLWRKGEESGNVQHVEAVYVDCDGDTILLKVRQAGGAACHEGYPTCFFRQVTPEGLKLVAERVFDPKQLYKQ